MKRWLLKGKIISLMKNDLRKHLKIPRLFLLLFINLPSIFLFAQQRITGKVTSGTSPVQGATVSVKNTTTATQTDDGGNFAINAATNSTLVISSVGFATHEVKVGTNTNVSVQLQSSDQTIESVVVVGYGTQKKATLTGSVSTVTGAELTKSPAPNVTSSLQGRLTGLTANQRSGQPGRDDPQILIRGVGTVPVPGSSFQDLLNQNGPLIIIDGVPRDNIGRLNPQDIESISVLKDGSAAIYGARAANGVILVTTKTGTRGKADFNFSYNYAVNRPTKVPDVLDAALFADVYN
jgi:TonB-dependent SusC/RagA subfamily outer membrane receptor